MSYIGLDNARMYGGINSQFRNGIGSPFRGGKGDPLNKYKAAVIILSIIILIPVLACGVICIIAAFDLHKLGKKEEDAGDNIIEAQDNTPQ